MDMIKTHDHLNKTKGLLRLPPGFRFHPTDEELVVQYLKRKVLSCPLPASVIPELDVCKWNPWDLPGDTEQERYFFSTKEVKYPTGTRTNRATGSGYWKVTGPDKHIVRQGNAVTVGMKKTLVFYRGKPPKGARTNWVMHEYRLALNDDDSRISQENWVLCRIFLKTRNKSTKDNNSRKRGGDDGGRDHGPVLYDFMGKKDDRMSRADNLSSSSSSSDASSGITTTDDDDRLSSTSPNSFTANFSNVFK